MRHLIVAQVGIKIITSITGVECTFQIFGGVVRVGGQGWGVTTVSNSLILGGWVTKVLKNGDKT